MGIRKALIRWFAQNCRNLPFRHTRDPYAIWVSEIMLQQTRVETVLRYYERFMERFPSVQALAAADEDEVMSQWSGLGYYRRARLLHQGVREVATRYGGNVPEDASDRRSLPGVGPYTAGAIGSIAFDLPEPLVDGNVARVLARLYNIDTPLGHADTDRRLWQAAEALVQGPTPGTLNQALMELGALVCTTGQPRCDRCPVRSHCVAYHTDRTRSLPVPRKKRPPRPTPIVALLATTARGRAVWLAKGEGSLFGGLWNLPMAQGRGPGAARTLLAELELRGDPGARPTARFTHVLTHRRLEVALFRVAVQGGTRSGGLRTARPQELHSLGVSSLTRKALRHGGFE